MKKTVITVGIIAGASAIAYFANNKNGKYALGGAVLGALIAIVALPKLKTNEKLV